MSIIAYLNNNFDFERYFNTHTAPGNTLIILDEIQSCNRALTSLKYFCELAPEYDVVGAGSLLGVHTSCVIKKMNQSGELTVEAIDLVLSEEKKPPREKASGMARFRKYFPTYYTHTQIDAVIIELLTEWKARAAV